MKSKILLLLLFIFYNASAQVGDNQLRNYFSSIIFIRDSVTSVQEIQGKKYEIHLKDIESNKIAPYKTPVTGSGFIVNKYRNNYLVTAQHVAIGITDNASIIFKGTSGKRKEIKLKDLIQSGTGWIFHPTADVAVLPIDLKIENFEFMNNLEIGALDYWDIIRKREAPDRFEDLIVVGFPIGLGESKNSISPITKKTKAASDLLILNRFDNNKPNYFYLLDDPSVSGFSGGPILRIHDPVMSKDRSIYLPGPLRIHGIVHGTINDPKDKAGRFAAIVPSFVVSETIDMAPSFSGIHTYKYSNGTIWSEREYKNGVPWTVISNYDPNGNPQEMGTLNSGNGTLFFYDENGKLIYIESYKNGERIQFSPALSDEELKKFRR